MAIPFYNQVDQDIYQGGEHYIPQQQYRLNYTPSTALASTVGGTGGVTGAQAANPYLYPQGGGGGGGGANAYGLDLSNTKTFNKNVRNADGTWSMQEIEGFWTPSGYKTSKGKNIEHAGLHWREPKEGDIEATEMDFSSFPSPLNFIRTKLRKWKENREIKKQEKTTGDETTDDTIVGGTVNTGDGRTTDTSGWGRADQGYTTRGGFTGEKDPTSGGVRGHHGAAQGGRIGYRDGEFVDEDINVEGPGFDVNENLMASDDTNTRILENLFDKYIELGFSPDQAEKMAMDEFQQMSMGPAQDQGIASLV